MFLYPICLRLLSSSFSLRPLRNYFEQWLALMLRWDPKARGGGVIEIQGVERPKCFFLLEQIVNLKVNLLVMSLRFIFYQELKSNF